MKQNKIEYKSIKLFLYPSVDSEDEIIAFSIKTKRDEKLYCLPKTAGNNIATAVYKRLQKYVINFLIDYAELIAAANTETGPDQVFFQFDERGTFLPADFGNSIVTIKDLKNVQKWHIELRKSIRKINHNNKRSQS